MESSRQGLQLDLNPYSFGNDDTDRSHQQVDPGEENEGVYRISKNMEELEQLRGDLVSSSIGSSSSTRKRQPMKKKDSVLKIEKPILPTFDGNGLASPSEGSYTPVSGNSSDSEAAAYLDAKLEDEKGVPSKSRRERLDGLNKSWNKLQMQLDARQNELMESLQQHLDYQRVLREVEQQLAANDAFVRTLDSLTSEQQLEHLEARHEGLVDLLPRLNEVKELAEMIAEDNSGDPGDEIGGQLKSGPIDELQAQLDDLSARVQSAIDDNCSLRNDIYDKMEELNSKTKDAEMFRCNLEALTNWYNESCDLINAEVWITFDRTLLQELLDQSREIENGCAIRHRLVEELLDDLRTKKSPNTSENCLKLEQFVQQLEELKFLAEKKAGDLGRLLKMCIKREEDIASIQNQVSSLQKWLNSRESPPDLLLSSAIGSEIKAAARDTETMQQTIERELAELESFMSKVHAEGVAFLRSSKPYTVNGNTQLQLLDEEDFEDRFSRESEGCPATEFVGQWNYLKHRLEKHQANIISALSGSATAMEPEMPHICKEDDFLESLETRQLSFIPTHQPDAITKNIQRQFSTLQSCWKAIIKQANSRDRTLEAILELQSKYMTALDDALEWLDSLELKIFSSGLVASCEQQLSEHEVLYREMNVFQREIEILNSACRQLMLEVSGPGAVKERAEKVVSALKSKVADLEVAIKEKDAKVQQAANDRWRHHKLIRELFEKVEACRDSVLETTRRCDLTLEDKRAELDQFQADYLSLEKEFEHLMAQSRQASADESSPDADNNSFVILERLIEDIKFFIDQLRCKLLNDDEIKKQFSEAISDYESFLMNAEGRFEAESGVTYESSPEALNQSLQNFKEFFEELDANWRSVNSFFDQLDPGMKQTFAERMSKLNARTLKGKENATELGKKFEITLHQWESMVNDMESNETWLDGVNKSPFLSEQSSKWMFVDTYDEACCLKKQIVSLQGDLFVRESEAHHVLQQARLLSRTSLNCPTIESRSSKFEQGWNGLLSRVNARHEQVYLLVEDWTKFNSQFRELIAWLERVMDKLKMFSNARYTNLNAAELYLKLQSLMALARDLEWNKMTLGRITDLSVLVNKRCDGHMPKEIEGQLKDVKSRFSFVAQELDILRHSIQRCRHGVIGLEQQVVELTVWLDGLNASLVQEDSGDLFVQWNSQLVLAKLHKFKGIELDLNWTQHDLDNVNEKAIRCSGNNQYSPQPTFQGLDGYGRSSASRAMPDLHQQIGVLNKRWNSMRDRVAINIQALSEYDSIWNKYNSKVDQLVHWIDYRKLLLSRFSEGCGHLIGVNSVLSLLDSLRSQVDSMCDDLKEVSSLGDLILNKHPHVTSRVVSENETRLHKAKNSMTYTILALKQKFEDARDNWLQYESCLEPILVKLSDAEFTISTSQTVSGNLTSCEDKVQNFALFENSLGSLQNQLTHFSSITDRLCQLCERGVCNELRQVQADVFKRWRENVARCSELSAEMDSLLAKWTQFELSFSRHEQTLAELNSDYSQLEHFTPNKLSRLSKFEMDSKLKIVEEMMGRFERLDLDALRRDKDAIFEGKVHSATLNQLNARLKFLQDDFESFAFRIRRSHCSLIDSLESHREFERCVSQCDQVLNRCSKSSENDRRRVVEFRSDATALIRNCLLELSNNEHCYSRCKSLATDLTLSDHQRQLVHEVNQKWTYLTNELEEKLQKIESRWINETSISDKLHFWNNFVRDLKARFPNDSRGKSYEALNAYLCEIENAFAELTRKQHLIHSILSDGQKLLKEKKLNVTFCKQLNSELIDLKEQWKSVVAHLEKTKNSVSQKLHKWTLWKSERAKFNQWLNKIEKELNNFEDSIACSASNVSSVTQLFNDRVKLLESAIETKGRELETLHELSEEISGFSDPKSQIEIKGDFRSLDDKWRNFCSKLKHTKYQIAQVLHEMIEEERKVEKIRSVMQKVEAGIKNTKTRSFQMEQHRDSSRLLRTLTSEAEQRCSELQKLNYLMQENDHLVFRHTSSSVQSRRVDLSDSKLLPEEAASKSFLKGRWVSLKSQLDRVFKASCELKEKLKNFRFNYSKIEKILIENNRELSKISGLPLSEVYRMDMELKNLRTTKIAALKKLLKRLCLDIHRTNSQDDDNIAKVMQKCQSDVEQKLKVLEDAISERFVGVENVHS